MTALSTEGRYDIGSDRLAALRETFFGGFADDRRTVETIARVWREEGYLLDPHTAVAACVADDFRAETEDARPLLIVSTASPYKFASDVAGALSIPVEGDAFDAVRALERATGVTAPRQVALLKELPVLHSRVCDKDQMGEAVLAGFSK